MTSQQQPSPSPLQAPVRHVRWVGVLAGLLSLAAFLAVAELLAVAVSRTSAPVTAVGQAAIDRTPHALKDFAVRQFGESDKTVLLIGIFATLTLLAALAGWLSSYDVRIGLALLVALTAVSAAAAYTRPTGSAGDVVPSLAGGAAGACVLVVLRNRRSRASTGAESGQLSRRQLLRYATLMAAGAAAAGAGGRELLTRSANAATSRLKVRIPAPHSPAPAIAGNPQAAGASAFYTPNSAFYRVDTALSVPQVDADNWSLTIRGMVDHPLRISYQELLAQPLVERDITLTCVSNEVGGPYVGNARWSGVLLAPLLRQAGIHPDAEQLLSRSADGWTCGTPTAVVMDGRDAMLAVAMNGEPLPLAHGFPVRMVVPGLYGYVSATKWVVDIEATTMARKAYWVSRGYAQQGPIKTSSRIDTPKPLASVPAGVVPIAGVAWAQHKGIATVDVRIDDGPWQQATLAAQDTTDTWRQWFYPWHATPGPHRITVRATDATGYTQTADRTGTFPDGATGQQQLLVTVT